MTRRDAGRISLEGPIVMDTVPGLLKEVGALPAQDGLIIDLSSVTHIDSSLLALMLQWRREMEQRGLSIRFENVPNTARSLIALYGVGFLLGAETPQAS